ncbi:branched-chain amino acid ABC transporter permease [Aquibium microcysteis]|uniref:branched-chain amino acid ABC transporter permease n=1 Tax=Aquibium microcysteis TaxID=675281 RepID=UPI00165D1FD1|nr:branched-chain amino acid ABC transporter permease [Aquibium microcysteis]
MPLFRLLALVAGLVLLVVAPMTQATYGTYVLCSWLIFAIAAMGLNLTLGYAGQISLAQASFMGIGAYATALITMAGIHWIVSVFAGMGLCFVIGLVLGYPALRVQHHFLAFITLAFSTLVFLVMRNEEWLTGGIYGLVGIPRPAFGPISTMNQRSYYYFTLVVFLIAFAGFYWIVRSPWGRAFKALRENPVRANSLGVDTRLITLLAFAIGAAYGGLSGALMSPLVQYIDPMSFTLIISLKILLMVVVGGSGYLFGPLLGAGLVVMLPEFLRFAESYYLMIYAGLVMILMVYCPTGLIGLVDKTVNAFRSKRVERGDLKQGAQL